jgi:NADPH:quinone reductase-like Zn-dependent oxidoreductase
MTSALSGSHPALVIAEKGAPHSVIDRVTPKPGPGQILIQVKSVAVNPVDIFQRDLGALIQNYPTVLGSDISGVVAAIGQDVPSNTPQLGSRVAAYASSFFNKSDADYGSFQQFTLVGADKVTPLPDSISFNEGAILPMSVSVAMSAWWTIQIPRNTKYTPQDKRAMLVWGASTSVGSAAVQTAKSMGFYVYATSSPHHHEYVKNLGADRVFDYKSPSVVSQVVDSIKEDNLSLYQCFLGQGDLGAITSILEQVRGDKIARIASAPLVPQDAKKVDGVVVTFVQTPADPKEAHDYFEWVFNHWLKEKLATGEYVASPHLKVVGKGLEDINKALDELKQGVSGVKLVVEL